MRKVSIIVPAFNAEKSISKTIESVINQTYTNWELIIIDDGSTDNTGEICNRYIQCDLRIKYKRIPNSGVSTARNTGIELAQGFYIIFIDSDDRYNNSYIAEMVKLINDNNAELGCCGYQVVDLKENIIREHKIPCSCAEKNEYYKLINRLLECGCFNNLWTKIFITNIILKNNIRMDKDISMGEDLLFVIEYIKHMSGKFATSDLCLYQYTLSPSGLQASNMSDNYKRRISQYKQLEKLYKDKDYPVDSLDEELMRNIYISLLEAIKKSDKISLNMILDSDEFYKVIKSDKVHGIKNKAFQMILKTKNKMIIKSVIKLFFVSLSISGKKISWK